MTSGTKMLLAAAALALAGPTFASSHTDAERKASAMAADKMATGDMMAHDKMATDKMAAGDKMASTKAMPAKKKMAKHGAKPADAMAPAK